VVDGNAVVTGRDGMGGKEFLVFPDLFINSPVYPGITSCKKRPVMGLHVIVLKKSLPVPEIRGVL